MSYKKFSLGNPQIFIHTDEEPSLRREYLKITERPVTYRRLSKTFYNLIILFMSSGLVLLSSFFIGAKVPFENEIIEITTLIYGTSDNIKSTTEDFLLPQKETVDYIYKDDALISMSKDIAPAEPQEVQESIINTGVSKDYSVSDPLNLFNETAYDISAAEIMQIPFPVSQEATDKKVSEVFGQKNPSVLIIHTHGTECYSTDAKGNKTNLQRSYDTDSNVVAVGRALTQSLTEKGIGVMHCEEMFDKESYISSYSRSYSTVNEYLKNFPTIKYVIDLHRDAISDADGNYVKALSEDGIAQLMFVIGTDEAGAKHKNWQSNLRVALEIQSDIYKSAPSLMRPIYLRKASFNQQLSPGYFILEAGTCANELSEVLPAIEMFAESFAQTITKEL